MRLPTQPEFESFEIEEIKRHVKCLEGHSCDDAPLVYKLCKRLSYSPLYHAILPDGADVNEQADVLQHLAVGLLLGLRLGFKMAEADALEKLCKS
jgi:hypothetical protein